MSAALALPLIDLNSPDRLSAANSIRLACVEHGFFYLVNHGVEETLVERVLEESRKFFSLPLEDKMKLIRKELSGYTPLYAEKLDTSLTTKGDSKETFYIGPPRIPGLNQWPSTDYGMITLLATDGVQGLQICRDKSTQPQVWEDVPSIKGAFIVNIGDMMERWTNCLFRSTLHRVMPGGRERYSMAFFLDPNEDCLVKCLESCCNESCPPRFAPIRSGDYLRDRFRLTYGS